MIIKLLSFGKEIGRSQVRIQPSTCLLFVFNNHVHWSTAGKDLIVIINISNQKISLQLSECLNHLSHPYDAEMIAERTVCVQRPYVCTKWTIDFFFIFSRPYSISGWLGLNHN